jgi:hypothetical protein
VISNIDFTLDDSSIRLPDNDVTPILGAISGLTLPVQVRTESGAKQPVFSDNRFVTLRLTRIQDQTRSEMPLTEANQNVAIADPMPGNEYRISVENLPKGYAVKSILQDGVNLLTGTLKLTAKSFAPAPVSVRDLTAPGAYKDTVLFQSNAGMPMTPIEITLAAASASAAGGLTVSGHVAASVSRFVSPSGLSGILFTDGTFEFHGVPAGRHVILFPLEKPDSPTRTFAATVVVGNQDVRDVCGGRSSGNAGSDSVSCQGRHRRVRLPLRRFAAASSMNPAGSRCLADTFGLPVRHERSSPSTAWGCLKFRGCYPENYDLVIDGFQHATVLRSVTIGDEDVQLNVSAKASN